MSPISTIGKVKESPFKIDMVWYDTSNVPEGQIWLAHQGRNADDLSRIPWSFADSKIESTNSNKPTKASKRPLFERPAKVPASSRRVPASSKKDPYQDQMWKGRPIQYLTAPMKDVAWNTKDTFDSQELIGNAIIVIFSPFRIVSRDNFLSSNHILIGID